MLKFHKVKVGKNDLTNDFNNLIFEKTLYNRRKDIPCFASVKNKAEIIINYNKEMYRIEFMKRKREDLDDDVILEKLPKKRKLNKIRKSKYRIKPKEPVYAEDGDIEILKTVNDEPTRISYNERTFIRLTSNGNKWTYLCLSNRLNKDKCFCASKIYYHDAIECYDVSNAGGHSDDCLEKDH
jgi:hypothetical protein